MGFVCPVCDLSFQYQQERDSHHESAHGWSSAMAARRAGSDEANLACERLEAIFESESLDASVDVSSDGWVVARMAPEAADRLALDEEGSMLISEDEQRSIALTLEEIDRRGYDLSVTQLALRERLNESLLAIALKRAEAPS